MKKAQLTKFKNLLLNTQEEIAKRRLVINPSAILCVECAEKN